MVHRAGEAADPEEERATHESPEPHGISGWLERVCRLYSVLAASPVMAAENSASNRIFENGWGFEGRYYFATLPVVRMFFNGGHFAVG